MSYTMTHLAVAKGVNEALGFATDLPQFYLGAIAPDAVHMRAGFHGDMKKASHFIPGDKPWGTISDESECDDWLKNFMRNVNLREKHSDFLMGYIIHVLTDIWNTREINIPFSKRQKTGDYISDCLQINRELYSGLPWTNEILDFISVARGEAVGVLVSADETEKFRDFILADLQKESPPRFCVKLTKKDMLAFIEIATSEIGDFINSNILEEN